LILWADGTGGPELWSYDGNASPQLIAVFPPNFYAYDIAIVNGVVFLSGMYLKAAAASAVNLYGRPAIYFYASGTIGLLWQADSFTTSTFTARSTGPNPAVAGFDAGLVFTDDTRGQFMFYDAANGGVHTIGSYTVAGDTPLLASNQRFMFHSRNQTTAYLFPNSSATETAATVTSSLVDFDSSLTKLFRGIRVEFDAGSDGNGGSVDIAYRIGDLDGAYTTLQAGAASGTEYALSNVTGRAISVKVTLNKGTSTSGPVLKRVAVRAIPVQQAFKRRTYVLNCTGRDGESHVGLRDGSEHPKDGKEMVTNLQTAATLSTAFAVTDELGTISNAVIESDGFQLKRVRAEEYLVALTVREV
jgi:hypothetical protein